MEIKSNPCNSRRGKFAAIPAHELGHALLHVGLEAMHRDRPVDGPYNSTDIKERQANKFAACFLMPSKLVEITFEQLFLMRKFEIAFSNYSIIKIMSC